MLEVLRSIFGAYTPVTYTVGSDTIIPAGLAGVNMEYVLGGALFGMCLYCCFRLLGIVLRGFK